MKSGWISKKRPPTNQQQVLIQVRHTHTILVTAGIYDDGTEKPARARWTASWPLMGPIQEDMVVAWMPFPTVEEADRLENC